MKQRADEEILRKTECTDLVKSSDTIFILNISDFVEATLVMENKTFFILL